MQRLPCYNEQDLICEHPTCLIILIACDFAVEKANGRPRGAGDKKFPSYSSGIQLTRDLIITGEVNTDRVLIEAKCLNRTGWSTQNTDLSQRTSVPVIQSQILLDHPS
jgi:hypothetical protein